MWTDLHSREEGAGGFAVPRARQPQESRVCGFSIECGARCVLFVVVVVFAGCSGSPPVPRDAADGAHGDQRQALDDASDPELLSSQDGYVFDVVLDVPAPRDAAQNDHGGAHVGGDAFRDALGAVDAADTLSDAGRDVAADGGPTDAPRVADGRGDEVCDALAETHGDTEPDGRTTDGRSLDRMTTCDGPCCRDGVLLGAETTCEPGADVSYGCPQGTHCGSVVAVRVRDRRCSGTSPACEGDFGPWGDWQPVATCDETASCVDGQPACVPSTACPCPEDMVRVPAGMFVMGAPPGQGYLDTEYPEHEVTHSAYCIDRYEVTVGAYAEYMNAVAVVDGHVIGVCWVAGVPHDCMNAYDDDPAPITGNDDHSEYIVANLCAASPGAPATSSCASHPMTYIAWDSARAYCLWRGKRLPSEAEWERAARGTDGRRYPWGNEAPLRTPGECFENADEEDACADGYEGTAPVGSFAEDRSPAGCYDMMGNVMERVADDWHDDYVGAPSDGSAWLDYVGTPPVGGLIVVRGGGWGSPHAPIWSRGGDTRTVASGWIGFRCAR